MVLIGISFFFFYNDPAPTEISPLPLHAPLPFGPPGQRPGLPPLPVSLSSCRFSPLGLWDGPRHHGWDRCIFGNRRRGWQARLEAHELRPHEPDRSEEHTSELQSPCNLVCRLLLE